MVNFKKLPSIYKEAMARITPTSVPVLAAEDETGIIGQIVYNQEVMSSLSFVGLKDRSTNAWTTLQLLLETGRKAITLL